MRDPVGLVTAGATGVASAFLTVTLPNMLGLFTGADMISKVLRGAVRFVAGGFVYQGVRAISPRNAPAALYGAMIGAGGGLVLDLLGTRLVLGVGDVAQTPGQLLAGFSTAGVTGYTRPMGSYTRPMGGYRGIYGASSMGMLNQGATIY